MTLIIAFVLGLLAGVIPKGIHIHHHHKENAPMPKQEGYNESMSEALPPEVKQYYNETNGFNRF